MRKSVIEQRKRAYNRQRQFAEKHMIKGAQSFIDYMIDRPFKERMNFIWCIFTGKRIKINRG